MSFWLNATKAFHSNQTFNQMAYRLSVNIQTSVGERAKSRKRQKVVLRER